MTNAYCDVTVLKARLGVTTTTDDANMRLLLEHTSRAIDEYCNRWFYTRVETRYFDGRRSPLVLDADLIAVTTLKTDDNADATHESTWAAADYILLPPNGYPKHRIAVDRRTTGSKADFAPGVQKAVEIAGSWGYATELEAAVSTINEGAEYSASDLTLTVTSGAAFAIGQTILIESEQLYISAISTNNLTVVRGVNGTTAAAHANGTSISRYRYPRPIVEACQLMAARAWGRRKLAFLTAQDAPAAERPLVDIDRDARPMLQPYRRVAFAAV